MTCLQLAKELLNYAALFDDPPVYTADDDEEAEVTGTRFYPYESEIDRKSQCCTKPIRDGICTECGDYAKPIDALPNRIFLKV